MTGQPRGRVATEYLGLTAVVAGLLALLFRPWSGGWSTPIVYRNDTLSVLAMVDAVGWTGTARGAGQLGAPHGTDWIDFPLGPDRLHLVAMRVMRFLSSDPITAMNLYLLAGFVLVALAAYGLFRHLRISLPVAGALSIAFTFAPYHFLRLDSGHLFLAAYYAVPLGVLLALWSSDGSLGFGGRRTATPHRRWWAAAWILVVGSASAYYAAFAVLMIVLVGVAVAIRRSSWRTLVVPLVVAGALGAVVVANVAGELVASSLQGSNNEASLRPATDSDTYGMRPSALLVPPPGHRIGALGQLGREFDQSVASRGAGYLGLIAIAGLGVIAVRLLRDGRGVDQGGGRDGAASVDQGLYRRLGVMVLGCTLVASVGGGAVLVSLSGFTQIRVWDRMSIVIACLALAGLGPALDRGIVRRQGAGSLMGYVVAVALVAVVMVDQIGAVPDRDQNRELRRADAEVAAAMESMLEPGDSVFQFPWVAFPGGVTDRGMPMYAHLGPWAVGSDRLSYNAGAMQGRGGDWQASWSAQEPDVMAAGLAAAGFDALYVDRRAAATPAAQQTPRSGAQVADLLERSGLSGGLSADGTRQWFDLRPLREQLVERLGRPQVDRLGAAVVRPIGLTFSGAATFTAAPPGVRLLETAATLTLRREDLDDRPVQLDAMLSGEAGATVEVTWPGGARTVRLGEDPTPLRLVLTPTERDTAVLLRTGAATLAGAPLSAPEVRLAMSNLTVVDRDLAADREQLVLSNS